MVKMGDTFGLSPNGQQCLCQFESDFLYLRYKLCALERVKTLSV